MPPAFPAPIAETDPAAAVFERTLTVRAEDALAMGDPAGASALLCRAAALAPARAETLYTLGRALRDLGRGDEGSVWRRRAFLGDSAALPTANHRLGLAFARVGRMAEAVTGQLQALSQNPDHGDAAAALLCLATEALGHPPVGDGVGPGLWIEAGHALFRLGAFPIALGAFSRAAATRPDDPALWRYAGDTEIMMARHAEAEHCFRRGVALVPGDSGQGAGQGAGLWAGLAHARFHRADHDGALTGFTRTIRLAPADDEPRRCLADTLLRLNRPAEAEDHLVRALALSPGKTDLWSSLGYARFRRQDDAGAAAAFVRVMGVTPGDDEPRRCLADTLLRLNRPAEAEDHLVRALTLSPDRAVLWSGLGHSRFRRRDYAGAAAAFARVPCLTPDDDEPRRCLADALFLLNRPAEAEGHLTRALALSPDKPELWTTIGHTRFRRRDYAGATLAFARAMGLTPGDGDLERFRDLAAYRRLNVRAMAGDFGTPHA